MSNVGSSEINPIALDRVTYHQLKYQWVSERLKEQLSRNPFYAGGAKQAQDEKTYWLNLAAGMPNRYLTSWLKHCTAVGITLDNNLPTLTGK